MQLKEVREQNPDTTVVYTKNACSKCDLLKRRLSSLNLKYVEINLEENPELVDEIKALGARSVPMLQTPKGKYLFGNIVEIEKELMHELRTPDFNRLYTPQQQLNLNAEFPLVNYHCDLGNGYAVQIGAILLGEDRGGVYMYEATNELARLKYSEHIISSRKAEHHVDMPVRFPNEEVKQQVEESFTAFFKDDIENELNYMLYDEELPVLQTPREINVTTSGWTPTQPLSLELQKVFNDPDNINFAAYYCYVDFEKALEDPELAEVIKNNLFITEEEFDALRGLPAPKSVAPTASQSITIAQTHKTILATPTSKTVGKQTQVAAPPAAKMTQDTPMTPVLPASSRGMRL